MKARTAVVGYLLLSLISIPLTGWTVATLWGWFIVPTLHAATLTVWQGSGIAILAGYLLAHRQDSPKTDAERLEKFAETVSLLLLRPVFYLAFGGIVYALASR